MKIRNTDVSSVARKAMYDLCIDGTTKMETRLDWMKGSGFVGVGVEDVWLMWLYCTVGQRSAVLVC